MEIWLASCQHLVMLLVSIAQNLKQYSLSVQYVWILRNTQTKYLPIGQ